MINFDFVIGLTLLKMDSELISAYDFGMEKSALRKTLSKAIYQERDLIPMIQSTDKESIIQKRPMVDKK